MKRRMIMNFRDFLSVWNVCDESEYDKVYIYKNDDADENHLITVPIYLIKLALGVKIEISLDWLKENHPTYKMLVEHLNTLFENPIKNFYYATENYSHDTCACVVLKMN